MTLHDLPAALTAGRAQTDLPSPHAFPTPPPEGPGDDRPDDWRMWNAIPLPPCPVCGGELHLCPTTNGLPVVTCDGYEADKPVAASVRLPDGSWGTFAGAPVDPAGPAQRQGRRPEPQGHRRAVRGAGVVRRPADAAAVPAAGQPSRRGAAGRARPDVRRLPPAPGRAVGPGQPRPRRPAAGRGRQPHPAEGGVPPPAAGGRPGGRGRGCPVRTRTKPAPTVGRPLLPRDAAVLWWLRVLDWIERTQDELQDPPPDSAAAGMQEAERRKLAGSLANFEFSWSNNRPAFDGGTVASTPLNVPRRAAR